MYFDSHCHLTDHRFEGEVEAVLERARAAGVGELVSIASDADDAVAARVIAAAHDGVWSTAGVHPHAARSATPEERYRVRALADAGEAVALGETGLDYFYDNAPRDAQRTAFAWHLETAAETGLPVVVHSREADDDTAAMIREAAGVTGVLHCFAGGPALLEVALDAGWYVSFSGLVTFGGYGGGDLVRRVPADRLLVETDSPYLAPVPHRGKRNEPAFVVEVARAVAAMRDESPEDIAAATARNAHDFYGLSTR